MTSVVDRPLHLPCSVAPDEEFQGPDGQWFSIYRAIVLDSWLTWKDALPGHCRNQRLSTEVACTITALTQRIHAAHMQLPDYRRLSSSPFQVIRWWDPFAKDRWNTGAKVLLRLEHYSAQRLMAKIPSRLQLAVRNHSGHWVEISLPDDVSCPIHSLDYDRVVTSES